MIKDWPGTIDAERGEGRGAEALAAHLAAAPSVTAGLLSWCELRGIGEGPIRVLARSGGTPPARLQAMLGQHDEPSTFRRVLLGRGTIALAEADNLFLPARLPRKMLEALAGSDRPFGTVLAPLAPSRRTVMVRHGVAAGSDAVLVQEALVVGGDGQVLAAVTERFLASLVP